MLIDGNGYIFYLLQTEDGLRSVRRELGGNYSAIESLIRDHIKLLRAADIQLKVNNPNTYIMHSIIHINHTILTFSSVLSLYKHERLVHSYFAYLICISLFIDNNIIILTAKFENL